MTSPTPPTRQCEECGRPLPDEGRFCAHCGSFSGATGTPSRPGAVPRQGPWQRILPRLTEVVAPRYEVQRLLGWGGMAGVYLAEEVRLKRRVAIKVIAPGLLMDPSQIERFEQEARTTAQLEHPNVVTIYEVNEQEDLHYFTMTYVPGRSLGQVMAEAAEPLPVDVVTAWLRQVAGALSYAHHRGVVHRDIKPGNILLDADGNALVGDFGIAKVAEEPGLTRTGMLVGTPAYMSPEQCTTGQVSGASDQYSLGAVAYMLLCGEPPFTGSTIQVIQAHVNEVAADIRGHRPDCPETLAEVVMRMLAKSPDDRWPTLEDAVDALGGRAPRRTDPVRAVMARLAAWTHGVRLEIADSEEFDPADPSDDSPLSRETADGESLELRVGERRAVRAVAVDHRGSPFPDRVVSFTTDPDGRIEVTDESRIEALTPGPATLRAASGRARAERTLAVVAAPLSAPRAAESAHGDSSSADLAPTPSDGVAAGATAGRTVSADPAAAGSTPSVAAPSNERADGGAPADSTAADSAADGAPPAGHAPAAPTATRATGAAAMGATPTATDATGTTPTGAIGPAADLPPATAPDAGLGAAKSGTDPAPAASKAVLTRSRRRPDRSKRSWAPAVAAGVAVVVAGGGALAWALRDTPDPPAMPEDAAAAASAAIDGAGTQSGEAEGTRLEGDPEAGGSGELAANNEGTPDDGGVGPEESTPALGGASDPPTPGDAVTSDPPADPPATTTQRSSSAAAREPTAAAPVLGTFRVAGSLPEGATVRVRGTGVDRVLNGATTQLAPGRYTVDFTAPGYEPAGTEITVREGATAEWPLAPRPVVVAENSEPAEATPAAAGGGDGSTSPPGEATPSAEAVAAERDAAVVAAIEAFGAALVSREPARLRAAWPSISSAEAQPWEQFMGSRDVQDLRVEVTVPSVPAGGGDEMVVPFLLRLRYQNPGAPPPSDPIPYRATVRRDGDRWVLAGLQPGN